MKEQLKVQQLEQLKIKEESEQKFRVIALAREKGIILNPNYALGHKAFCKS